MTKYAQLVLGSAGTGKSTYCRVVQEHCTASGRTARVGNLDPAADAFGYQVAFDVRDLISVDDVMTELDLGPNGGLLYAMEHLIDNIDWLGAELDDFVDDDYLLLDCPGQIELYTSVPVFTRVAQCLRDRGFNVVCVYCVDSTFVSDAAKFIAGQLTALAAMVNLELPHVNVLTKCDLLQDKTMIERFLSPSGAALASELGRSMPARHRRLNEALCSLLDEYDMVTFLPLDVSNDESISDLLQQIDHAMQYGEELEPREPLDEDGRGGDGGGGGGNDDDDDGDNALGGDAGGWGSDFAAFAEASSKEFT